jgi:hypothetical protein
LGISTSHFLSHILEGLQAAANAPIDQEQAHQTQAALLHKSLRAI